MSYEELKKVNYVLTLILTYPKDGRMVRESVQKAFGLWGEPCVRFISSCAQVGFDKDSRQTEYAAFIVK